MSKYDAKLRKFRKLVRKFHHESIELELKGGDIGAVQNAFGGNLGKPRAHDYDPGYERVGAALDKMVAMQQRISRKYGAAGCDGTVRIQHSIMKPTPCRCAVCT